MKTTLSPKILTLVASAMLLINGCVPAPTPASPEPSNAGISAPTSAPQSTDIPGANAEQKPEGQYTIAEVEELAGFDVKETSYLPAGVSFDYATYQDLPAPAVTLQFKIVHEQYGDMGRFLQIMQEPRTEAPPETTSCGESVQGCEILEIDGLPLVYRLEPAGPESLYWYADGFSFWLLRTAGEPNKLYKDELMKVAASLK